MSDSFNYTYSAKQQEEVKNIRGKYTPREENKLEQLRKLDDSTKTTGTIAALAVGTAGTLLLGVGMTCTMVWTDFFALGVVVGVIGIGVLSLAYPIYTKMVKKQRDRLSSQIVRLSDELLQQ